MYASIFKSSKLFRCATLSSCDDGSSMTHTTPWGSSHSGNETNHWFVRVAMFLEPLCSFFLGASADLSNHDNTFSLRIISKSFKTIDEICSVERISTNSHTSTLTESSSGGLMNGLICQCSTAADYTDISFFVNVSRHDTNLALPRFDNTRTVRANEAGCSLGPKSSLNTCHVLLRDAFCDSHNKWNFILYRIHNGCSTERWWDVNH
mmetsp:Transcript_18595/g.27281  ORF Transcript_18595/g.27281 Transcript_18595/m.27281 type:complete len:207 (+) Transcript_18595:148-768(+)